MGNKLGDKVVMEPRGLAVPKPLEKVANDYVNPYQRFKVASGAILDQGRHTEDEDNNQLKEEKHV